MRKGIILTLAFVFLALPMVIADNSDFVKLEQSRLAVINLVGTTAINEKSNEPVPVISNEGLIVNSGPASPAPVKPMLDISIISPNSTSELLTSSNLDVVFNFRIQAFGFMDSDYPIECIIELSSDTESILTTEINDTTGIGSATHSIVPGDYDWIVICNDGAGRNWKSNSVNFNINQVVNNGGNSGSNNGGGGSRSNNDDEGSNRRILPLNDSLNLENLSTNPPADQNNNESGFSKITGAVVGLLGKRGALGFGILLVVLGIAGLIVYNRAFLGLVKVK